MIEFEKVSKRYPGMAAPAVDVLDLRVEAGELIVLLGESGCGKTTTLKMINRLIEPSDGVIRIEDEDHATLDPIALRRRIGYVFQSIGLFPHMTVRENISVVPRLLGWKKDRIDERVNELIEMISLDAEEVADRFPRELSGGQRQRVGVARALAVEPRIMLMDEPFGALDPINRDRLQDEFVALHKRLELTSVLVTHDMTEALLMADRIAVMNGGKLLQLDTPHVLMTRPADEYVEQMIETPKRQADRLEALAEGTSVDKSEGGQ